MRVLMVAQHYWPETFINTDVCETLVARGHQVTVLTGLPNYPEGSIPHEYRLRRNRRQVRNGVDIVRVPIVARGKSLEGLGKLRRAANYASFWWFGSLRTRTLSPTFDVVLTCQTSPVTMSAPALAYSKRWNARVLLWCCDLSPADLLVGGVTEESLPYRLYARIARRVYSRADIVAVSSPRFSEYLQEINGVTADKIVCLPNYAEDLFTDPGPVHHDRMDGSYPTLSKNAVNFVFAGNVGNFQSVETIVLAAIELMGDKRIAFHVVGSGSRLDECMRLATEHQVTNITFHGRRRLEDMPAIYEQADAMLMSLCDNESDPVVSYTLPRRTSTILAAGKPIMAALRGEVARLLDEAQCGYHCAPQDHVALARLCARYASLTPADKARMGRNARAYYEEHFSKERFFNDLEGYLGQLRTEDG